MRHGGDDDLLLPGEFGLVRAPRLVPVPVMDIRVMRMPVHEGLMSVLVGVRLAPVPLEYVLMSMVSVVAMGMGVGERLVNVLVLVHLGEVQPDAGRHQPRRQPERPRHRLAEGDDGNRRADEGRSGEEIGRAHV